MIGVLVSGKSVMSFDVKVEVSAIPPDWMGDVFFDEFPLALVKVLGSYLISHLNHLKLN